MSGPKPLPQGFSGGPGPLEPGGACITPAGVVPERQSGPSALRRPRNTIPIRFRLPRTEAGPWLALSPTQRERALTILVKALILGIDPLRLITAENELHRIGLALGYHSHLVDQGKIKFDPTPVRAALKITFSFRGRR